MYRLFLFFCQIYTFFIKKSFQSFGKGSIIKPFLNLSHPEFISLGKNVSPIKFEEIKDLSKEVLVFGVVFDLN